MENETPVSQELPFDGEFFLSRHKKFEEIIFFVHFYEGSKRQLLRHIKFVNSLGFDAFAFTLSGVVEDIFYLRPPVSFNGKFGTKHLYADQIETLLNLVPGKKIMYTFSNPSASAIEAMARRRCSDTVAMVCDSGPTARFTPSAYRLLLQKFNQTLPLLQKALSPFLGAGWSPFYHKDLQADLATFPKGFQILSVRGWKDPLIPPEHIDEVFEPHTQLNWRKLGLPEAGHLNGLRDFKQDYTPTVGAFLNTVGTKISKDL